jgi:hypothetical protein
VVEGFTKAIISLSANKTLFFEYLKQICQPFTTKLLELCKEYETSIKEGKSFEKNLKSRICKNLDKLTIIARFKL